MAHGAKGDGAIARRKPDATRKLAVARAPNFTSAITNLATMLRQMRRETEAMGLFRKSVEIRPTSGAGHRDPALVEQVRSRDERDMTRESSPLRPAAGAINIDTSSLSIQEVTDTVLNLLTVKGFSTNS